MKTKIRRFRHVDGFLDGTRYIEINSRGTFAKSRDVKRMKRLHTYELHNCLGYVAGGTWEELPVK